MCEGGDGVLGSLLEGLLELLVHQGEELIVLSLLIFLLHHGYLGIHFIYLYFNHLKH